MAMQSQTRFAIFILVGVPLREYYPRCSIETYLTELKQVGTNSSSDFLRGNTPCPYYQSAFYTFSTSTHGRET